MVKLKDPKREQRRKDHPCEPNIERPETDLRGTIAPAVLGHHVTEAEQSQAYGQHSIDTHHCRVSMVGCECGPYLVVGDDR